MKKELLIVLFGCCFTVSTSAQWTDNGGNITTTDSVGIGTLSPCATLDVSGNLKVQNEVQIEGTNAKIFLGSVVNPSYIGAETNGYNLKLSCRGNGGSIRFFKGENIFATLWADDKTTTPKGYFNFFNGGSLSNVFGVKAVDHKVFNLSVDGDNNGIIIDVFRDGAENKPILTLQDWNNVNDRVNTTFAEFRTDTISFQPNLYVGGNVGIGTAPSDEKLAVNGAIHAKEVKVDLSDWSDFVFEKEYELPTLEEVESYVSKNKHLPEIPSKTEVSENGINLGEMNAKLLQKIEELTIYMIDMNKRMGQLEQENSELKNEVAALKTE